MLTNHNLILMMGAVSNHTSEYVAGPRAASVRVDEFDQLTSTLIGRLQTSLELERVLEIFMDALQSQVSIDGYSYRYNNPAISILQGRQLRHHCAYNLSLEGSSWGEVSLYRGRRFSESELQVIESLLSVLLYPLRNAVMYRTALLSAYRDALTGVNNRNGFEAAFKRELSLAHRNHAPLSILVIDVDHFKRINDTYGHCAGDEVLKQVATTTSELIRDSDLLFRYGGEEFVLLLSQTDRYSAIDVGERIRSHISQVDFYYGNECINVSVSIGLSSSHDGDTCEGLLKRADEALYLAKREGRNQLRTS